MKFKKLSDTAITPEIQTKGSACYDMAADMDVPTIIKPGETRIIPTNIAMEIPEGYAGLLFSRSGLSSRNGLRIAGGTSVIDSDYRGGISVPLHNDSFDPRIINHGMRIAQLMIVKMETPVLEEVDELSETDRGEKGFGSSGV